MRPLAPARTPLGQALITLGLVALVATIGVADYWTGTELAFSIFFLVPIALAAWLVGQRTSIVLSFASAASWFLADRYGGYRYSNPMIPYWNAAMGLGFFLIIALTLSARRRAAERIVELMKVKSEFVSMVSHELRTPLTCIKEGIALALDRERPLSDLESREYLLNARRNVDRLARLVNDVLAFQKLEAGRVELERVRCDLGPLVREAVADFALLAELRGLELSTTSTGPLPAVDCDPERVRLVIDNLIGNALKFTARGWVRVFVERLPDGVRVSVQDTGPGIAREDQSELFQGFTRLAARATPHGEGTGLGLAIARRIVELHGGRVGVVSSPGGSTFSFTLPCAPEREPRADFVVPLHRVSSTHDAG